MPEGQINGRAATSSIRGLMKRLDGGLSPAPSTARPFAVLSLYYQRKRWN
jgi:hypothetical protein